MARMVFGYKDFQPKGSHEYLIDNSVLMYAFAPIGGYNQRVQTNITNFLQNAINVNSGLHTTSLVISEFYNRVFQDFFTDWKEKPENSEAQARADSKRQNVLKSLYRPSEDFKNGISAINGAVNQMLKLLNRFNDSFNSIDLDRVLNGCLEVDYNDSYFIELANQKNWIIVSRDRDIIYSSLLQTAAISFLDD